MAEAEAQAVRPEAVATGLQNPWALAFLPQGRFLVTERPGRLRVVEADGRLGPPVLGLPAIDAGGQGGLLDVITDAGFAVNRRIYFCFSEPAVSGGGHSTALARAPWPLTTAGSRTCRCFLARSPSFPAARILVAASSKPTRTASPTARCS